MDAPRPRKCGIQRRQIGTTLGGFRDLDHLGPGFAPGQDVGMMLVWPMQHRSTAPLCHRPAQPEKVDQPVQPRCRARAAVDHRPRLGRAADPRHFGPRRTPERRHMGPAVGGFGVAVGAIGQDPVHHRHLDLPKRAARRDIVGVKHRLGVEGAVDQRVLADQPLAQPVQRVAPRQARAEVGEEAGGVGKRYGEPSGRSGGDRYEFATFRRGNCLEEIGLIGQFWVK